MSRDGYVARWLGREFEAVPGADGEIRLYAAKPTDGFEELRPDRFRRIVPAFELESLRYVRTVCRWRGEPFVIVGEHDGWSRVEYAGGRSPVAEALGLERIDQGVWQSWAPSGELEDVREEFL
ncbi:hypothetical protein [Actinomadura harenae]|uniref:Uncharacterized protein n=1 Tax=Actinomadura harenae TaxID=2483351 RepID=A0A3M2LID1_9ACTN|nr:hypothetical protein [Actinomadura harenae]RMI37219.1 hypothetical protein EBO15_36455 [Actinomadura harenae]